MKPNWKETPVKMRIAAISSIVVCIAVVVLAVLQIFDVWSNAGYVYLPLVGVNLLLQAYCQWKSSRNVAVFSLCAAVFIVICTIVVWIIK